VKHRRRPSGRDATCPTKSKGSPTPVVLHINTYQNKEKHIRNIIKHINTVLTIENYLNACRGGAVGLDVTPTRFIDPNIRKKVKLNIFNNKR
jgi:hypothetical protein